MIRCLATGHWNGAPPECQGKDGFPPIFLSSKLKAIFLKAISEVVTG